jgi:hypothetical protein
VSSLRLLLYRGPVIRPGSTERIQKEKERISTTPFLLWHFSSGDKIVAGSTRVGRTSDMQQLGNAGKSTSDYVTRRFNASSDGLKKSVGLHVRGMELEALQPGDGIARQKNRGCRSKNAI